MKRARVVVVLLLGIILVSGFACGGNEGGVPAPTPTPTPTPTCQAGVICLTVEKLCDDYNTNEIAADAKYKGETLEVSGVVNELGRCFLENKAYIIMNCGWITDFWCYFDAAYESQLVPIEIGDLISVQGECTGKNLLEQIELEHCTSVQLID
jgi:hypothetical protein